MNKNIKNLNVPTPKYRLTSTPPPPPQHTELNSLSKTPKRKFTSSAFRSLFRSLFRSPFPFLFRPLLFSFFIATFFALFFSCDCAVEITDNPKPHSDDSDTPQEKNTLQITSTSPANNAQGVLFSPRISIEFDTNIAFNSDSDLTLSSGVGESYSFNKLDTRLSLAGNSLTIEFTNSLTPATLYTFTIPKDTFTLLAGNEEESKEDTKSNDEFSFTFTTADPWCSY